MEVESPILVDTPNACQFLAFTRHPSAHRLSLFVAKRYGSVGRRCGVGRGLGVALGVALGVEVGVGLTLGVGVTVGVGEGVGVEAGALYNSALAFMVGKSDPPA